MMERKRRARINDSLLQLKSLVFPAIRKEVCTAFSYHLKHYHKLIPSNMQFRNGIPSYCFPYFQNRKETEVFL